MVNIYNDFKNEIAERMAYDLFDDFGIHSEKIKPGNMIDVMLMLENNVKVDVQQSEWFSKAGEFSIDFIADHEKQPDEASLPDEPQNLFEMFAQQEKVQVNTKGKHFQANNFDYLIVFLYDKFIPTKEYNRNEKPKNQPKIVPNHTLLIKSDELAQHILDNREYYLNRLTIQEKTPNELIHKHDEAWVSIPVDKLRAETNCLFFDQLAVKQEEVFNYMNR